MNASKTKWYKAWKNARQRCLNPKATKYEYYGGKGIQCKLLPCDVEFLWKRDGASKMKQASLDRIDGKSNYSIENCRFIEFDMNRRLR